MLEQAWNFIKKETPAQVFSCDFYEIFLEHLFYRTFLGVCSVIITWITNFRSFSFYLLFITYYLNHQFLEFFFLKLIQCVLIGLLVHFACFCSTYQVITMIKIVFTLTKFVLYVCWLNKLPLSFPFWINELTPEGKKKT